MTAATTGRGPGSGYARRRERARERAGLHPVRMGRQRRQRPRGQGQRFVAPPGQERARQTRRVLARHLGRAARTAADRDREAARAPAQPRRLCHRVAHRVPDRGVHRLRVGEADLQLLRVHVYIDVGAVDVEEQHRGRVAAARHQLAVALQHRVHEAAVAHPAPPDVEVHAARRGLGQLRRGEQHLGANAPLLPRAAVERPGQTRAQHRRHALLPVPVRRRIQRGAPARHEAEVHARVRHGQAHNRLAHVARLGRLPLHELEPRGQVEQEVAHLDRRAVRAGRLLLGQHLARLDDQAGARPLVQAARARGQGQARHRCDGRQRLAAEPHRRQRDKVVERAQLRGGVAHQRHARLVAGHAGAVVEHADQVAAAALDLHRHLARPGVERVLHQLLDHRGRPLHHLTGCDLIDHMIRQDLDAGLHPSRIAPRCDSSQGSPPMGNKLHGCVPGCAARAVSIV